MYLVSQFLWAELAVWNCKLTLIGTLHFRSSLGQQVLTHLLTLYETETKYSCFVLLSLEVLLAGREVLAGAWGGLSEGHQRLVLEVVEARLTHSTNPHATPNVPPSLEFLVAEFKVGSLSRFIFCSFFHHTFSFLFSFLHSLSLYFFFIVSLSSSLSSFYSLIFLYCSTFVSPSSYTTFSTFFFLFPLCFHFSPPLSLFSLVILFFFFLDFFLCSYTLLLLLSFIFFLFLSFFLLTLCFFPTLSSFFSFPYSSSFHSSTFSFFDLFPLSFHSPPPPPLSPSDYHFPPHQSKADCILRTHADNDWLNPGSAQVSSWPPVSIRCWCWLGKVCWWVLEPDFRASCFSVGSKSGIVTLQ